MNKHIKGCLLLLLLTFLMINIASATEVTNDTSALDDNIISPQTEPAINEVTSPQTENKINKNIEKNEQKQSQQTDTDTPKTIIINSTTFDEYVDNTLLNDKVNNGDTLDFQGILYGTRFTLYVNKSVNIISSTNDSFIGWSGVKKFDGNDKELIFKILEGGSGTNVTNIHFYNTHVVISKANNVNLNNITVEACIITGSGEGITSIRDGSSNITVTNSYFLSDNNGGVSTLVCAGAQNVLIENNTIRARLMCGNLVYFTTYNQASYNTNKNITLKNNYIDGTEAVSQSICIPLVMQGSNHYIINNTIVHNCSGIDFSVMSQINFDDTGELVGDEEVYNTYFINNTIQGNLSLRNVIVSGNNFDYLKSVNATVTNNTITRVNIGSNTSFINNNVKIMNITGTNNVIQDNNYNILLVNETASNNTLQNNIQWNILSYDNINESMLINNTLYLDSSNIPTDQNIYINIGMDNISTITLNNIQNKTFKINSPNLYKINIYNSNVNIIESKLDNVLLSIPNTSTVTCINSTLLETYVNTNSQLTLTNTDILSNSGNQIISSKEDEYAANNKGYEDYFDNTTHYMLDSVMENSNIIIRNDANEENFNKAMIINKPINLMGLNNDVYNGEITFIDGSQGSTITNMILNNNLNINTTNISIINNTINKQVIITNSQDNTIKNNLFNTDDLPLTLINTKNTIITNNTIQTTNNYTISLDELSQENIITENNLTANNEISSNTIYANNQQNTIKNNYPKTNTTINIDLDKNTIINAPSSINITVTSNNKTVTKGYVIIISNGIQKLKSELVNGELNTNISLSELDTNEITVFYFSEELYYDSVQTKTTNVQYIKSNLNVTIEETKLYENSTITIKITDEYGNNVPDGLINISINDMEDVIQIHDGVATYTLLALEEYNGKTITIYYNGTLSIENNTLKTIFNTLKGDSFISLRQETQDDVTTIIATVTNRIGQTVTGGYIQFVTPKTTKMVKVLSEETNLTITTPTTDTTVTATFRNHPNYESSNTTLTIYNKKDSIITLNPIETIKVGENINITGKLSDTEENSITNANIKIIVNNEQFQTNTDNQGTFTLSTTATQSGTNNITVIYEGNEKYNPTSTNTTSIVNKKTTTFLYYNIKDLNIAETAKITAKLLSDGQPVKAQNVTVAVNGEIFVVKTSSTGYFVIDYVTSTVGMNNITFTYEGNSEYEAVTNTSSFNVVGVKKDVVFSYYAIKDVNVGDTVKVSAKLLSDGQPVKAQTVTVKINNENFVIKTSSTGYFAFDYVTNTAGVNNLSFVYEGNAEYNAITNTSQFNVVGAKKDVVFSYYAIKDVNVGDTVKISAKLLSEGQPIKSQSVTVNINGEDFVMKTSSTGYFAFNYVTKTAGVNNLSFIYDGNAEYNAVTNTSQFNVVGDKKNVSFLYYGIKDVNVGDTVKISAKLLSEGQPVKGQNVIVTVNGEDFTAKTSSTGYFVLEYVTTTSGVNNITFTYAGSDDYNAVTNTTGFNVIGSKSPTTFLFYNIKDVKLGETVKISAKLLSDGLPVKGQSVTVTVNDEAFTVKTSTTGYFILDYNPVTTGINNIIFAYGGNSEYEAVTNTTQFKCIS